VFGLDLMKLPIVSKFNTTANFLNFDDFVWPSVTETIQTLDKHHGYCIAGYSSVSSFLSPKCNLSYSL